MQLGDEPPPAGVLDICVLADLILSDIELHSPVPTGLVSTCAKAFYQTFFLVLIDLIVDLLVLIITPFDNQTES